MSKTINPLVSMIVLSYNQARFVLETLESVKAQTYKTTELIIVDDCSTDQSVVTIESWLQKNGIECTFIRHQKNQGVCKSINDALAVAKGKYISMIASDDAWLPDKILQQVEIMENQPDQVGVLYSDAYQMDENGSPLPMLFIEAHRPFPKMPSGDIHKTVLEANFIPAMGTLIRSKCYKKVGIYDESLFFEDWDMWIRISHEFEFIFDSTVTAKYRIVTNSMSRSGRSKMAEATDQMFFKYLKKGWLENPQRETTIERFCEYATNAYRKRLSGHVKLMLERLYYKPQRDYFIMFIFSLLHISHEKYLRFNGFFRHSGHSI